MLPLVSSDISTTENSIIVNVTVEIVTSLAENRIELWLFHFWDMLTLDVLYMKTFEPQSLVSVTGVITESRGTVCSPVLLSA